MLTTPKYTAPVRLLTSAARLCQRSVSVFVARAMADWMQAATEWRQDRLHVAGLKVAGQHRLRFLGSDDREDFAAIVPSSTICDLGVFTDADLSMRTHVQRTVSRCFTTLRLLRSIKAMCQCLCFSRMDYCASRSAHSAGQSHSTSAIGPECYSAAH